MLNVSVRPTLRRLFGATGFSIMTALALSVPSFAVYYNLGMFWKGTAGPAAPTFTERKVAMGGTHGCAVISDGTVKCWGANAWGQLGDGTTTERTTPVTVTGLSGVVSITAGDDHSCVGLSDGTAKCWGSNSNGQLGDGTTTSRTAPVTVTGISGTVIISAGGANSCALLSDGTAKCWGWNSQGSLGDGTTTQRTTPVAVTGLSTAISISVGRNHTCASLSDGTAKCWGFNGGGSLGDGTTTNRSSPVTVTGLSGVTLITAGDVSCSMLSDGTAKCWGYNSSGQLGDGTTTNRSTPVAVTGLSGVLSISAKSNHACAGLVNGIAKCWGGNLYGQLGDGTTANRSTPVAVSGLSGVLSITPGGVLGSDHTCAGLTDGTVKCWGLGTNGQLGNGTTANSSTYVSVTGSSSGPFTGLLTDAVTINTEYQNDNCSVRSNGTVRCWGEVAATFLEISSVVSISVGDGIKCAVLSNGTAKCWGNNFNGKLGDGTTTSSATPVTVTGLSGVRSISLGDGDHSCAALSDGTVKCWGGNASGQLGNGTTTGSLTPVAVTGLSGALSINLGTAHSCANLSDGTAKCWGHNAYGQLGDGTATSKSTPVAVTGLSGVRSILASNYRSCALLSNGTGKCWGSNSNGQLGDGTNTTRNTPVSITGISGILSLGVGDKHTFAVLSDGTLKTWGYNVWGQLGIGTTTDSLTPVTVSGVSGGVSIDAGLYQSCVLHADGTVKCWGAANKLGNGTTTASYVPVSVVKAIDAVGVETGNNAAGATTLVTSKPANTLTGHVMIASITARTGSNVTAAAGGWSSVEVSNSGNISQYTFSRVATSADDVVSTYTWNISPSAKASGVIVSYENADTTSPILANGSATSATATITAPTLSTTETDFQSLVFYGIASDSAITGPGGYYVTVGEDATSGNGATSRTRTFATHRRWTTSPTGDVTGTTTAVDNVGQHVLLKKAP